MAQTLHGFACHLDATRFEIEDALVRGAAASLLGTATQIEAIIVDVGLHVRSAPANGPGEMGVLNALISISSPDPADTRPEELDELVAEAAIVSGSWASATVEIGELSKPWVGRATPGPKVTIVFDRNTEYSPDYRVGLAELANEVREILGDVGCRLTFTDDEASPFQAAISYWFPNPQAAEAAFETNGFDRVKTSPLVDKDSVVVVESVEHRIIPNPNAWATTTGIQPPAEPA